MRFSFLTKETDQNWHRLGAVFAALSLVSQHFSPAVASISLGITCICGLVAFGRGGWHWKRIPLFAWLVCAIFLFQILCTALFFDTENHYWDKVLLRLPFLFFPFLLGMRWTSAQIGKWLSLISIPLAWISLASVLHYVRHYRFYNVMVLESKPIPVYSQIYHIEFSFLLAVTALLGLIWILRAKSSTDWWYGLLVAAVLVNILSLHVLSARTGILAFWTGLAIWTAMQPGIWKRIGWKGAVLGVVLLSGLLLTPSVRNRLTNTLEDFRAVSSGADLNDKSFGRRWLAWNAAADAINAAPWTGYGLQYMHVGIEAAYDRKDRGLHTQNQIPPHNQFLELALQNGLPALLLFALLLIWALIQAWRSRNAVWMAFIGAFAIAIVFESLWERQAGVLIWVIAMAFLPSWTESKKVP